MPPLRPSLPSDLDRPCASGNPRVVARKSKTMAPKSKNQRPRSSYRSLRGCQVAASQGRSDASFGSSLGGVAFLARYPMGCSGPPHLLGPWGRPVGRGELASSYSHAPAGHLSARTKRWGSRGRSPLPRGWLKPLHTACRRIAIEGEYDEVPWDDPSRNGVVPWTQRAAHCRTGRRGE